MSMKSLLTVTLDAKQVREACALFVKSQVGYDLRDESFETRGEAAPLTVVVTKKRVRKQKGV